MNREALIRVINFFLLLLVPISVVTLMALVVVIVQGNQINLDRILYFSSFVLATASLKFLKYRILKK